MPTTPNVIPVTVKVVVVLLALALVGRRVLPRRRLPWMVPIVMAAVIVVARTVAYVVGD